MINVEALYTPNENEKMVKMRSFFTLTADDIQLNCWDHYFVMPHTHTHIYYELYFCPDDLKQHAVINGIEYQFHHPCVIISSPYTVHAMSSTDAPEKGYRRYVLYFEESILNQLNKALLPEGPLCRNAGFLFRLSEEDAAYLSELIQTTQAETKNELKLLLALFLNKLVKYSPFENALKVGESTFYIQNVLQYIAENYQTDIGSESLAIHFSISRSKLDRDFKQFTGITVHTFLDICRLNQAKLLLEKQPKLSVGEIASLCGFSGETYFFTFFKKFTGYTPAEYRNNTAFSPH